MEIFIAEQCKSLAESFILGLIFGAGYDIISIFYSLCGIRSKDGKSRKAVLLFFTGDSLYMLWMTICASLFLYYTNYGQFRLYLAAGCAIGFAVYRKSLSRVVMPIAESIVSLLKRMVRITVIRPLGYMWTLLAVAMVWLARHTVGALQCFLTGKILKAKQNFIRRRFPDFVRL